MAPSEVRAVVHRTLTVRLASHVMHSRYCIYVYWGGLCVRWDQLKVRSDRKICSSLRRKNCFFFLFFLCMRTRFMFKCLRKQWKLTEVRSFIWWRINFTWIFILWLGFSSHWIFLSIGWAIAGIQLWTFPPKYFYLKYSNRLIAVFRALESLPIAAVD